MRVAGLIEEVVDEGRGQGGGQGPYQREAAIDEQRAQPVGQRQAQQAKQQRAEHESRVTRVQQVGRRGEQSGADGKEVGQVAGGGLSGQLLGIDGHVRRERRAVRVREVEAVLGQQRGLPGVVADSIALDHRLERGPEQEDRESRPR